MEIKFMGLKGPDERAAAARLARDIYTNGILDVERRARECFKLEDRIEKLESEVARNNDNLERVCDLLLQENRGLGTKKFIYYKGDDNSKGKLIGIGSKREGASTLYPYGVE
ncbi:hypothetical protein [Helicobacter pylori]|uniref:hypothetical protein n=1 Tax=Helicobacter pylori TaxID=210 RepID=UPI000AE7B0D1|nr:hypothetical protein [Helicobacter pylori]